MKCYYAWNTDAAVLHKSTSGGVFSVLSGYVLECGGTVYGAYIDDDTMQVKHIAVKSIDELDKLRSSKYQQSFMGNVYKDILKELDGNKKVLFSGTPCQCAGLKSYLKVKGRSDDDLLCVEVLCHGVTNSSIVNKYVESVQKKNKKKVKQLRFRTKDKPWYHSGSSVHIVFDDGTVSYKNNMIDTFYAAYTKNLILRPSCYSCRSASLQNRASDLTIGDFWGAEEYIKDKTALKNGIGLVLVHTDKAAELWEKCIKDKKIYAAELDINKAVKRNAALVRPARQNKKRSEFFTRIKTEDFDGIVRSIYSKTLKKNRIKLIVGYNNVRRIRKLKRKLLGK